MTLVSTNAFQTIDKNFKIVPNVFSPSGPTQKLTSTGTSSQTAIFDADKAVILRIVSTQAVHYKLGTDPTATADDVYLPADVGEQIRVPAGYKIAVIGSANFYATILE